MEYEDSGLSIFEAAKDSPDGLAVRDHGRDYTFKDIAGLVEKRIKELRFSPGVPYPLTASPSLGTMIDIYALLEKRIPILLLHPGLTENEKIRLLLSIRDKSREALPDDCAVILFTSGTTGKPKPAVLTRKVLLESAASSAANIPLGAGDVWQMSISPARIGGFSILTRSLLGRSAVSLPGKFSADKFVELIENDRVTLVSIVPTMLAMILEKHPGWRPPEYFRALLVGGASTSRQLKEKAVRAGLPVILTYGMTETSSNVVTTPYESRFDVTEGSGMPNAGVEIKSENGDIYVKGGMVMHGYWGREPLVEGEWFKTGDLGYIAPDGSVHIQARRTDVIISGGDNVYPIEVEEALESLPGIRYARVVGIPDEVWGGIVTALLVPEEGKGLLKAEEIVEGLSPILATYKSPRRIAWVKELPVLANGKPNRSPSVTEGLELQTVHYKTKAS